MKTGDYVSVLFDDGRHVGIVEEVNDRLLTVSFQLKNGQRVNVCEIPIEMCMQFGGIGSRTFNVCNE